MHEGVEGLLRDKTRPSRMFRRSAGKSLTASSR